MVAVKEYKMEGQVVEEPVSGEAATRVIVKLTMGGVSVETATVVVRRNIIGRSFI